LSSVFCEGLPAGIRSELENILQEATQANRVFAVEETVGDRQKVVDKAWAAKIT